MAKVSSNAEGSENVQTIGTGSNSNHGELLEFNGVRLPHALRACVASSRGEGESGRRGGVTGSRAYKAPGPDRAVGNEHSEIWGLSIGMKMRRRRLND